MKNLNSISDITKLRRIYKMIMLEYLGVALKDQPSNSKMITTLLESFYTQDPERVKQAWDYVVNKNSKQSIEKVVAFDDVTRIVSENVKAMESSAIKEVAKEYGRLSTKLANDIGKYTTEAIDREAKKFNTIKIKVGNKAAKTLDGTLPEEFPRLCQLAQSRRNILMVGPTGCGKTYIARKIAEALDLEFASQSCSAGVSESSFVGWLIPTGKSGQFVYVSSEFVRLYENGGVFLFDEVDASDANVLVFLNQALANEGFNVPQRYENPYVKKHKDFVAIAAANTFGSGADAQYHGRNALDEATLDRFRIGTVFMNYSETVERSLVSEAVYAWGQKIRKAINEKHLEKVLSTRTLIDAEKMVSDHDWTIGEFEKGYFASWSEEEISVLKNAASMMGGA